MLSAPTVTTVDEDALALRLRGVRQRYSYCLGLRSREVLAGIDLEIARGRTLGMAGPNGSGKSTLLRILAGIDRAHSGEVSVLGGSPEDARVRRRVGYLPEDSPFPHDMTARSALDLLGAMQHMRRSELHQQGERMLDLVGLRDHARQRLGRFSRGMLRRFGLAQAWLHAPDLLLLDEPTAGLDAQGFEVLEQILAEAHARGTAVLVASHVLSDLQDSCDDMAIILDGRIALRGTPSGLLSGRTLLDLYRGHSPTARAGGAK